MQTFKLFVSSPSDVMVERRRVENVVSRLNGEFAGVARLETIRWETEFYQAYRTFQAQIPRSTDCDIVIGILKWRLGTELPPDFGEKLPNGKSFPSGTAYEILTAVEKRQTGEKLPDIYVFRFAGTSPSVPIDDPNRSRIEHDWQLLKGFFQEWFVTEQGQFKAAFNQYSSEDDFEAQLEKLLREWLADKVAGGRPLRWPIEVKGSPFCGLAAFGAKHTPVFFGRSADTTRAVDLWREAGKRGSPYLLIVGASGSGKSSLVRAGIVPRLTTPGVIEDVDVWRIAVMRPSDSPAGPFAALATALMQDEASLPKEEEGRGPALPEIGQGAYKAPSELASLLRHADAADAIKPIVNALSCVGAEQHDEERYGREVRCDLVLLIDQFEELFAGSVSEAERTSFVDLMAGLVGSGRVWIAATLRGEFYAHLLEQPALKKLKDLGATYDLTAPGPAELAEIVRAPAEAAGLVFEADAATGERLDERLLRDAERPDMLPLVQLALSRLFEGRRSLDGGAVLPLTVYERLGGLKGIINEAGEMALASLSDAERTRLPRLLRQLAVPAHDKDATGKAALTIRAAPLAQAAPDAATHKLLDALVAARLLTTSGTEADAQVRLVHQRVLQDWTRAHTIVADSADFYRIRDDLEESRRRWEDGKRRAELLLASGLPLSEAESIAGKYGDELTSETHAYVRASRKRANRAQMIAWGSAAVFLSLLLVACYFGYRYHAEWDRAERNYTISLRNYNISLKAVLAFSKQILESLNVGALSVAGASDFLKEVDRVFQQVSTEQEKPDVIAVKSEILSVTADILTTFGRSKQALEKAEAAKRLAQKLVTLDSGNADWQHLLYASSFRVGDAITESSLDHANLQRGLKEYRTAQEIAFKLAAKAPDDPDRLYDLAFIDNKIGEALTLLGDFPGAFAQFRTALDIAERNARAHRTIKLRNYVAVTRTKIGWALARQPNPDLKGAIARFDAAIAIQEALVKEAPDNDIVHSNLRLSYRHKAGMLLRLNDLDAAIEQYGAAVAIGKQLVDKDPGSALWRLYLALDYRLLGDALKRKGDMAGALDAYRKAYAIWQWLVQRDHSNPLWQGHLKASKKRVDEASQSRPK